MPGATKGKVGIAGGAVAVVLEEFDNITLSIFDIQTSEVIVRDISINKKLAYQPDLLILQDNTIVIAWREWLNEGTWGIFVDT